MVGILFRLFGSLGGGLFLTSFVISTTLTSVLLGLRNNFDGCSNILAVARFTPRFLVYKIPVNVSKSGIVIVINHIIYM